MQQQIGRFQLLERGAKRRHQVGRQFGNEANRIRQQDFLAAGQHDASGEWVECGKELVLGQRPGLGQAIEQRALARIGVADDGDHRQAGPFARRALAGAMTADSFYLALQGGDARPNQPSVDFDLSLTCTAADADAADLALEVGPGAGQPGQQILEPREMDLDAALVRSRTLGEDVQDEQGAIDHTHAQDLFHRFLGAGWQLIVADDQVGRMLDGQLARLIQLAAPEIGARVRMIQALRHSADDVRASGARQLIELVQ